MAAPSYKEYQERVIGLPSYKDGSMTRRRQVIVNAIPARSRVLSVACGAGTDLKALEAKGCTTRGIDIAPAAIAVAKAKGIDAIVGDADTFQTDERIRDFMLAEYDVVIFSKCLGYLKRKNEMMRLLRAGTIIVSQRNLGHWRARLRRWRGVKSEAAVEHLPYVNAQGETVPQNSLRDLCTWGESYGFKSKVLAGSFFSGRDGTVAFYR
jgi:methionine biosynthesis protein MetW